MRKGEEVERNASLFEDAKPAHVDSVLCGRINMKRTLIYISLALSVVDKPLHSFSNWGCQ